MHRFTSAFEETKRELEVLTSDMDASFSLQLAAKLSSEELPQKLQEASLVSRATLQAHMKQVRLMSPAQNDIIQQQPKTVYSTSASAKFKAVDQEHSSVMTGFELHSRTIFSIYHLVQSTFDYEAVHSQMCLKTSAMFHNLAQCNVLVHVLMFYYGRAAMWTLAKQPIFLLTCLSSL